MYILVWLEEEEQNLYVIVCDISQMDTFISNYCTVVVNIKGKSVPVYPPLHTC